MHRTPLSRRRFIQLSALAGASFYFGIGRLPPGLAASLSASTTDDDPIANLSGSFTGLSFSGDDAIGTHDRLWRIEQYIASKGGRPTTARRVSAVVVGGGMSGLLSAYFLRKENPVVLEWAPRFGGNSKGERYQGSAYSIGSAYITVPEEGGDIDQMLREVGIRRDFRHEQESETRVIFGGVKNLWGGETGAGASAARVNAELKRIYEEAYPEIPWSKGDPLPLEELKKWDRETAAGWLRRVDPDLHPHIEEYFQLYGWSSFGGSLDELSAAQFANFVSSETEGVLALPGGNSAIASALLKKLRAELPSGSLSSNAMVLEVKETANGVEILYEDSTGALRLLQAPAAIVAVPKYVAGAIVKGLSRERTELWRRLSYRAYAVANVLLKGKVRSPAYDLFCLKGEVPEAPSFGRRSDRPFTDVVFGAWADHDRRRHSILTIYKPYPFEGARSILMADAIAHKRIQGEMERELPAVLRQLGIPENAVAGVRLTRWGHAIPLSRAGFIADGTLDKIGASQGRIHFANQDNYMNPAFETCFAAAQIAAAEAIRSLRG